MSEQRNGTLPNQDSGNSILRAGAKRRTPSMISTNSSAIEAARKQVFVLRYPTGEEGYYLWGFAGEYDATVRLTVESFARVLRFLYREDGNHLSDGVTGVMASEGDPDDEDCIPMGARVSVSISFADRTCDESPYCFHIERVADDAQAAA